MANMDDGPPSSVSKADRLKLLRAHQTAWKNLTWTKKSVVSYNPIASLWKCLGGVLGSAYDRSLRFIQVPSVFRGIEEKEWAVEDIGFRVGNFTMDPSQDLLVVLDTETYVDHLPLECYENHRADIPHSPADVYRLHLRSLSDGKPHPFVSREFVSYKPLPDALGFRYTVEVFSSHLALLSHSFEYGDVMNELVIWNWMTGNVEKVWKFHYAHRFVGQN